MSPRADTRRDRDMQPANSHPTTTATKTQLKDIQKRLPSRVLSSEDWEHWTTKGYVVVRQAVPPGNVERLVDVLWRFDEKDPSDPETWYAPQRRDHKMPELNHTGMLEIYNHQALWDNPGLASWCARHAVVAQERRVDRLEQAHGLTRATAGALRGRPGGPAGPGGPESRSSPGTSPCRAAGARRRPSAPGPTAGAAARPRA